MDVLDDLRAARETVWVNPGLRSVSQAHFPVTGGQIQDAADRLERFRPFLAAAFGCPDGLVESPLVAVPRMQAALELEGAEIKGRLFLKMDSHLAIAGSVKARGGVYAVLKQAEALAVDGGLLSYADNYAKLLEMRDFFSKYTVQVGSTGNLGLSVGVTGAALGFRVIVHMSADAKGWKKDLLRSKGVTVIEYGADYGKAVAEGRRRSVADKNSFFIDDEHSVDLFLGYAVAAERLAFQLREMAVPVDKDHPLAVYIPCGVGGAPGGVSYGLKRVFGDHVHCFFVEPVQCPCMLLGMATGRHDGVCVQDFGLTGVTQADGLAVSRPSGFVGRTMEHLLSGVFTVADGPLFHWLRMLNKTEGIRVEPSACAAFAGPAYRNRCEAAKRYFEGLNMENGTQICWATGGALAPEAVMSAYLETYL